MTLEMPLFIRNKTQITKRLLNYLLVGCLIILTILAVYGLFFTKEERKARVVDENRSKIKKGMTRNEVISILANPDTIYPYRIGLVKSEDTLVMQYYLGFGSADALMVLIRKDTVIEIISDN